MDVSGTTSLVPMTLYASHFLTLTWLYVKMTAQLKADSGET